MKTGSTQIWRISSKKNAGFIFIYIKLIISKQWECSIFLNINNLKNVSHDRGHLKIYEKLFICSVFVAWVKYNSIQCYEFWHKTENGIWYQIRQFVRICLLIFKHVIQYKVFTK